MDGTYDSSLAEDPYIPFFYDLCIYEQQESIFTGSYCGSAVHGTITNSIIAFSGNYNGNEIWFYGEFDDDDVMYASVINFDSKGRMNSYYTYYSTDPEKEMVIGDYEDIRGDWSVQYAKRITSEGAEDILGTDLTILRQRGPVFYGNIEIMFDGAIETIDITGMFTTMSDNGLDVAFMLDSRGTEWTMEIDTANDTLDLFSNVRLSDNSMICNERFYTRGDGSDIDKEIIDLKGTTWYEKYSFCTIGIGQFTELFERYEINITEQVGSLIYGKINLKGEYCDVSGYIMSCDHIRPSGYSETSGNLYGYGYIEDDTMYLCESYYLEYLGGTTASVCTFSQDPEIPESADDLIGVWMPAYATGMKEDNIILTSSNLQDDMDLLTYRLTVIGTNGNMFWGTFGGTEITGTYINGTLTFAADLEDNYYNYSHVSFFGLYVNDHVFQSCELFTEKDGSHSTWQCIYSNRSLVANPNISSYGFEEDWSVPDE